MGIMSSEESPQLDIQHPGSPPNSGDAPNQAGNLAVTRVLAAVGRGDTGASSELLPLVYGELRKLARARMAKTPPGNTLQPTALVHEAFIRLVGNDDPNWNSRGHFFAASAEAMRQILVDQARQKARPKHGGDRQRVGTASDLPEIETPTENMIALDEAITKLESEDEQLALVVKLRYFAGLNREETAAALGKSVRSLDREWRYIVARLHQLMDDKPPTESPSTDGQIKPCEPTDII
jgi:RNA polymerase sigma factor (TIGR02999 family)